jgi:2-C-methyl-D-erythritol 4-phosphate cytidylyltransferase
MKNKVGAVVPAAGLGKRFGAGENKPMYELLGRPLVVWVVEAIQLLEEISEIILVVKETDMGLAHDLAERYKFSKVRRIVPGGKERQDSVYNGLEALDEETFTVVIHDGARPLVDGRLIRNSLARLEGFDGVVAGVPVKDTIKSVKNKELVVDGTLDRSTLWAIQTPQTFYYAKIREAHRLARTECFYATDDAALIEHYGGSIRIIEGSYQNLKITTMEDISIAEKYLEKQARNPK